MSELERELLEFVLGVPEGGEYDFARLAVLKHLVLSERKAFKEAVPAMRRVWIDARKASVRSKEALNALVMPFPGSGPVTLPAELVERWRAQADAELARENGVEPTTKRAKRPS